MRNLPFGVAEWMVPGNRKQEEMWEEALENEEHLVVETCSEENCWCKHARFAEDREGDGDFLSCELGVVVVKDGAIVEGEEDITLCEYVLDRVTSNYQESQWN